MSLFSQLFQTTLFLSVFECPLISVPSVSSVSAVRFWAFLKSVARVFLCSLLHVFPSVFIYFLFEVFRKTISTFNFLLDFIFYFLRVFSFIVVQVFSENNFWCQFSTRFWNFFFHQIILKLLSMILEKCFYLFLFKHFWKTIFVFSFLVDFGIFSRLFWEKCFHLFLFKYFRKTINFGFFFNLLLLPILLENDAMIFGYILICFWRGLGHFSTS